MLGVTAGMLGVLASTPSTPASMKIGMPCGPKKHPGMLVGTQVGCHQHDIKHLCMLGVPAAMLGVLTSMLGVPAGMLGVPASMPPTSMPAGRKPIPACRPAHKLDATSTKLDICGYWYRNTHAGLAGQCQPGSGIETLTPG